MANLKAIRDRIQSVKNTRKITEAMRLVAAAKVRRAQEQVTASRPFADTLARILFNLSQRLKLEDVDIPLLKKGSSDADVKSVAILVISGDRGLCGGYNNYVIKRAETRFNELKSAGLDVKLVTTGQKASQYFKRRNLPVVHSYTGLDQIPTSKDSSAIADQLLSLFLSDEVDRVEMIYTRFVSLISSRPVVQTIVPLDSQSLADDDDELFRLVDVDGKLRVERQVVVNDFSQLPEDMIYEQNPVQILESLLPLYLNNQLLRALQESAASELAARMTAMSNASDNASDLMRKLTLSYNKARQANITQELLEVVAGANAL
jgi:F-type H+-transporting ATPase subunit gamma